MNKRSQAYRDVINAILEKIEEIEKNFSKESIVSACNRYSNDVRKEKKARREIAEAEKKLSILKRKYNK